MKQWYVLHTKPNFEYKVTVSLNQQMIQSYLPEVVSPEAKQRKQPFFPCYLFARFDFEAIDYLSLQWTPGLRRVISFDDRPIPLADEVVELIQQKLSHLEATGGYPLPSFNPGDSVRIKEGPFRDMVAIFDGPTTPAQRVQVLLDFLGHDRRVTVEVTSLEKITSNTEEEPANKRPRRTRGRGRRIS